MGLQTACLMGIGAAVAAANAFTTRALWASPMFERSQKVAQTVLIWVLPGSFVFTRHFVRGTADRADGDPTVSRDDRILEDPSAFNHGHGDFGGHHH
jgi:hypothetical protein